jgi:hypothetical protein
LSTIVVKRRIIAMRAQRSSVGDIIFLDNLIVCCIGTGSRASWVINRTRCITHHVYRVRERLGTKYRANSGLNVNVANRL